MDEKTFALIARAVKKELGEETTTTTEASSSECEYSDSPINSENPLNRLAASAEPMIKQERGDNGYDAWEQSPCFNDDTADDEDRFGSAKKDNEESPYPIGAAVQVKSENLCSSEQVVPLDLYLNTAHHLNQKEETDGTDTRDEEESIPADSEMECSDSNDPPRPAMSSSIKKEIVAFTNGAHNASATEQNLSQHVVVPSQEKKVYPKPMITTSTLIALALRNSETGCLSSPEVYDFICKTFPYYRIAPGGWKNVVRSRLSSNLLFINTAGALPKGNMWALNPDCVGVMEKEFARWITRPPRGINDSLAHPSMLASLVKGKISSSMAMRNSPLAAKSNHSQSRAEHSSPTTTKKSHMVESTRGSAQVLKSQLPPKKKLPLVGAGHSAMSQSRLPPDHVLQSRSRLPAGSVLQRQRPGSSLSNVQHIQSPVAQDTRSSSSYQLSGNKLHLQKKLQTKSSQMSAVLARMTRDLVQSQLRQNQVHAKQHIPSSSSSQSRSSSATKSSSSAAVQRPLPKVGPTKNCQDKKNQLAGPGKQSPAKRKQEEGGKEDNPQKKKRRLWVDPLNAKRASDGVMAKLYPQLIEDPDMFYNFTQMSRSSFEILLMKMGNQISHMDTNWRKAIQPRERLLLTLRYLVTNESTRCLSSQFQIGMSTIRDIIYEACDAICSSLKESELPRLTAQAFKSISVKFYQKWKYPHCIGALGTRTINLQIAGSSKSDDKRKIPILLQGVVDADGTFIAVDVIDLSSDLYGCVLKWSAFGEALYNDQLPIPKADRFLEKDVDDLKDPLPYVFISGNEHPHLKNLLRPYVSRGLDDLRRNYNLRHHKARVMVDRVFESMSAKWSVLRTTLNMSLIHAYKVILTCCVLHNFLKNQEKSEDFDVEEQMELTTKNFRKKRMQFCQASVGRPTQDALNIRDNFSDLLNGDLFIPLVVIDKPSEISLSVKNSPPFDETNSVKKSNTNLPVPVPIVTDDANSFNSYVKVTAENVTNAENSVNSFAVTTENVTDDRKSSNPSVDIMENVTDDGESLNLNSVVTTKNDTDDRSSVVTIENVTNEGNSLHSYVVTTENSTDGNSPNLSIQTEKITEDENMSNVFAISENITIEGSSASPSVLTENFTFDEGSSPKYVLTENLAAEGNLSKSVLSESASNDESSNLSVLPQKIAVENIDDVEHLSYLSVPSENRTDDCSPRN